MLFQKILQISVISANFLLLTACSTGKDVLGEEGSLEQAQASDKVSISGTGDVGTFSSDEACGNPLKVGNQTYYFDFDNSTIRTVDTASLTVQARYLIAHPHVKVLIVGNTDERGSREYNIGLGQRRAVSVEHFLRANGVSKSQILTVSYGAERPVAFGHAESDYAKNRRANLQYQAPVITNEG